MFRSVFFFTLFNIFLVVRPVGAQTISEGRPKIGLALSGGGAKGLIYIPLLKVIDSLEIKIDYITGTSMGGLVGGLYAIGYTGKELDSIARNIDWEHYLSDRFLMSKINMEEKDEYERYLFELKSNSLKPRLPLGLIEGQNILRLFNDLTFKIQHIQDFSKFKIPFKCFATDIVEGKSVALTKGSLALALRTTMSIPTVFTPIDTAGMLLVDGGVLNNFPVKDLKEMGADFIIGGNCSSFHMEKNELTSILKIFEQVLSISITEDYQSQKDLCDLLLDYSEALKSLDLGTSDFSKTKEILDLGEKIAKNFVPLLSSVAENQKKYLPQLPDSYVHWKERNEVSLESFKVKVSNDKYKHIIENKIQFKDPEKATSYEINRAIDRIYGTRFFDRVYYYLEFGADSVAKLVYRTEGENRFTYKLGLHYDTELSAGATVNFTYRKLGKRTSRSLVSIDISENPKLRAGYQLYFGDSGWWLSIKQAFSSIKQNMYERRTLLGLYRSNYAASDVSLNLTIGQNNLISLGTQFEFLNRKSTWDKKEKVENLISRDLLSKSPYHNLNFFLGLERNTLERAFFPRKGLNVSAYLKFVPYGSGNMELYKPSTNDSLIVNEVYELKPKLSAYAKLHIKMEQYIPLAKIFSLHYRYDLGIMFISHGLDGRSFDFPAQDAFYLGGVDERERERINMYIPFYGYKGGYAQSFNFMSLLLEGQIEPIKNIFVIPNVSFLAFDDGNQAVYGTDPIYPANLRGHTLWAWSGGVVLAYKSPLGILKTSIAKSSNYGKWAFYAAFGFRF